MIIGEGAKMDALCHISHNTQTRIKGQLAVSVVLGGSVTIGDYHWIGLNSTIQHKLKIGANVIIGSGSSNLRC